MSSNTTIGEPTIPLGVTSAGFSAWRQSDWTQSLVAGWQAAYGSNVNTDPQSVSGLLINLFAERFALISELMEGVYNAQYPGGAEGVAVDNQLAIVGLTRKQATSTITAPSPVVQANGITLYGLVLTGDAGTVVPQGCLFGDTAQPPNTFTLDNTVTIGSPQNAVQTLTMAATPTAGNYALVATTPAGTALTTDAIDYRALPNQTLLVFSPGAYTYQLGVGSQLTGNLTSGGDPAKVAQALNTLLARTDITAAATPLGTAVVWPAGAIPQLTATGDGAPTVVQPVQAHINALTDGTTQPFTDVTAAGSAQTMSLTFGGASPASNQPSTSAQAVPLLTVANNTLTAGRLAINVAINNQVLGHPAQAIGSATCKSTGPIAVAAGALSSIQTPQQGLAAVTNPLACITGRAVETDAEALARRGTELSAAAQGPLEAILQKVKDLDGVIDALAFANVSNAAQQMVVFNQVPTQGTYQLLFDEGVTSALASSAAATDVQAAIRAITGLEAATVTGSAAFGFQIDFQGALGGQAMHLVQVANNTTDATIRTFYGRSPKSLEMVVEGGDTTLVAQTLYQAAPAGLGLFGAPAAYPLVNMTAGQSTVTVDTVAHLELGQQLIARGIPAGATITSIVGVQVTLSANAVMSASNVPGRAGYGALIADSQGNAVQVSFSRPMMVPIYCNVVLTSDTYLTPGDPTSGLNPAAKWRASNVSLVQSHIVDCLNKVKIGGSVLGLGTNGVRASLADIEGIVAYDCYFGLSPNPTNTSAVQLLANQALIVSLYNVNCTWT